MTEEQMAREVQRGKRFNYICLGMLWLLVLGVFFYFFLRPLDQSVTIAGLQTVLEQEQFSVMIGKEKQTVSGEELRAILQLNTWKRCKSFSEDTKLATIRFAEFYTLTFYPEGRAVASNGYAQSGKEGTAYYQLSNAVIEELLRLSLS